MCWVRLPWRSQNAAAKTKVPGRPGPSMVVSGWTLVIQPNDCTAVWERKDRRTVVD